MKMFIDTSSKNVTIAKITDKLEYVTYESNNDITMSMYQEIDKLFTKDEIKKLEDIYVVSGPGSFTGIRIGVIFAKTLTIELNKKIYPVNIMKLHYLLNETDIAIDARGNKYYYYNGENTSVVPKEEIDSSATIDPQINMNKIFENNLLDNFTSVNPYEFKIEYVKKVL